MTNYIKQAADLIAMIDPALAKAFVANPFHRHQLITAFHAGLNKSFYAPMAERLVVQLRSLLDAHAAETSEAEVA